MLRVRTLGEEGPTISTVGFGAWAAGGGGWAFGWGAQDDAASIAAMRRAIDLGVNWIDDSGVPIEESWGAVQGLVDEGKVRWGGVSNFDIPLLERCEAVAHVQSLQPPFSLIRRDTAADLLPWCSAHGTGVICYSPMEAGLLTDSFTAERVAKLPKDDWRHRSAEFHPPSLARNLALRNALRPVAERHGVTVAAVAVGWVLAWPGLTAAIVGARSPEQVDGWIAGAGLELDEADLDEIAAAVASTGSGSGPVRPRREG